MCINKKEEESYVPEWNSEYIRKWAWCKMHKFYLFIWSNNLSFKKWKKTLSWHLNPFILSNYFQFWCNWKWYIHFNILMHWNSINIWSESYSVYFLLIHVQHNFELKKIKEYVLKYFVKKTFFFIVFDVCLRLTFFLFNSKSFLSVLTKIILSYNFFYDFILL